MVFSYSCTTSYGPQPVAFLRIVARELREDVHHLEVALDLRADAGTHDLDDDFFAGTQSCGVHLRDRGGGERRLVELGEHFAHRFAVSALDDGFGFQPRERRHAVLQFLELVGDVDRQQVASRGQRLAELHPDRPQLLECEPDALTAWTALAALEPRGRREVEREPQRTEQVRRENDLVEPVTDEHALDLEQAGGDAEAHGEGVRG